MTIVPLTTLCARRSHIFGDQAMANAFSDRLITESKDLGKFSCRAVEKI